jgi:dihydrofolate synthase / folylpolyglutamate synthase
MLVNPIKTHKITTDDHDLIQILDKYLKDVKENSVVVVTSKIISICQGRVVKKEEADKNDLIKKESNLFIPAEQNKYNVAVTITDNLLIASAGIDESNGNGFYILWPHNPYQAASQIRDYLKKRFKLKNIGVIITDSKTTPLRWGIIGIGIAYSGFKPLNDLIGKQDIFGRELKMTKVSVLDGLAAAAAVVMGEGSEQTPISIIEDIPFVQFDDKDPSTEEIEALKIKPEDDLYAQFFESINWQKGEK